MTGTGRAAALAVVLAACLPPQSILRRDEVPAQLYRLALDVDVRTDGLGGEVAPFRWHLDGTLGWSYTRTFRDGSLGHLVRFESSSATVAREGAPAVPVAAPLADALFELRAFPDGEVLSITGASRWIGTGGHAEVVDLLWPLLSPHLPANRDEAQGFLTSWPTWVPGGPRLRTRLEATWTPDRDTWTYTGALVGQGGPVTVGGDARGVVTLGDKDTRLLAHTFDWTREVTTRWPSGQIVVQTWRTSGDLRHTGEGAAPALDMPIAADSLAADALPVRLADGRVVEDAAVDLREALPFLFLPDDIGADAVARARSSLVGTGSM